MSIWILALVLCAVFGAIGFFSGAIRTALLWIGVVLASIVTGLIAPKLVGLMPKIGIKHPLWIELTPYIIIFSILALVVYGVGFAVHHKVALIYKYQRDDYSRMKWENMNRHVGLSVGLLIAIMLFFVIARIAYVGGYLTAQVAEDKANPFWINFRTSAREDMHATGLDKAMAALDKTSGRFYDASDVVGLIYHNPVLQGRLANYPYFLGLSQNSDLQEIGGDKEYNDLIYGKASFGKIINHPNTKRILANREIVDQVKGVDLKDLKTYLETGKSTKYEDQKILGRWILDKDTVLTAARKQRPDMKGNELLALRKGVQALPDITVINTIDNKTIVKSEGGGAPADPAATPAPAPAAAAAPQMPERYRRAMQQQQPAAAPKPAAAPVAPVAPPVLQIAGEGEWKTTATGDYEITINDNAGKPQTLTVTIHDDEMTLTKGPLALIFNRAQ
ncbi:MAG TPA: CvpA family protein [Verrucomicrobiae bacterium]|nr:CvpA family protein [Verrucomicrobiae bacterium]